LLIVLLGQHQSTTYNLRISPLFGVVSIWVLHVEAFFNSIHIWSHFKSTWAQISVANVRSASFEARGRQCSVISSCPNLVPLSMNQIQNNILIMQFIISFDNLFDKSWPGSLFFFLPLQKFAIRLLGYETLNKFVFIKARIAVEIHPADD
jgi:hypothetical protein